MSKEKNQLTYELRVTERHLNIIKEALDVACRLRLGQVRQALWSVFLSRDIDIEKFDEITGELKKLVFPELFDNSSYGVGWREDNNSLNTAQIAYEIDSMIRYLQWLEDGSEARKCTVDSSPPLHYSTEELIELRKLQKKLKFSKEIEEAFYGLGNW